jgi:hypothetical protein
MVSGDTITPTYCTFLGLMLDMRIVLTNLVSRFISISVQYDYLQRKKDLSILT